VCSPDLGYTRGAITDASITAVAQGCPQLTTLNIIDTLGAITDASITAVARGCPQLATLHVSYTGGAITEASMSVIRKNRLAAARMAVPRVRPLHATPRLPRPPSPAPADGLGGTRDASDVDDAPVAQAPCPKSHRAEQPTGVDGDEDDADTQPFSSSSSISSGDSVDAG
jgi:hypothetical protein